MGILTQTFDEVQEVVDHVEEKGWAVYFDNTYTSGSPLSVTAAGGDVLLECDGAGANTVTSELPDGVSALWDTTNDKLIGTGVGDGYDVRIQFKAVNDNVNGLMDVKFDIGDPSGIEISARTYAFPKGASQEITFSIGIPLFSMATFVANGCKIFIDSITGDTDIYDISIFIKRDYVSGG